MENTHLNDPDFDAPQGAPSRSVARSTPNVLDHLSPKLAFWAGIIVAMLVASTIGFFVLLTIIL
ncbi:hypothetical protein A3H75_00245 [Candidatus Uhrbacteria bacterium RIFCSPLOWO2_02_FULL_51_9]|uniref:Uncharacterized protein n=1 Tax=Candidatus Uhrbacteria bacterium RIFCSPLOWO2_02_FULL_51_9 TaxID=1802410 RepID=A0A1F7VF09_9BACT|nr:MAG: hypothetical protein A3H75_00245 [Candidatus Uhrbacteria bacterium RIFCSPLOWO2_02_FULL_51_9]